MLDAHLCSLSDDVLSEGHHVIVVSIGLVQLDRCELRVMAGADAFVAENAPNLKHLLKAANDEALQM